MLAPGEYDELGILDTLGEIDALGTLDMLYHTSSMTKINNTTPPAISFRRLILANM